MNYSVFSALPRDRTLLEELTHRINNEYSAIIQFVSVLAARSTQEESKFALAGVLELLHNHARLHRVLRMPVDDEIVDTAAYFRDLCQSVSRCGMTVQNVELVLLETSVRITSEQCWLLGMIVTELITNACKHAFDKRGGIIRVEISSIDAIVECRVCDSGTKYKPIRSANGLRIIYRLLHILRGSLSLHSEGKGSTFVVTFPK